MMKADSLQIEGNEGISLEWFISMNGLMEKYKKSLERTPGSILLKDMPAMAIDYRGLVKYAQSKGVEPGSLSKEEKAKFCSSR